MIYIKRFLLMIQFLTRIPVPVAFDVDNRDFAKGLVFAPAVGLIIGFIMAFIYYLACFIFPAPAAAIIAMLTYIFVTGGLHLDGLGDTFDGLFSNRSKERMLEIMRDSRVGTNAVLAIFMVLFLDVTLLIGLEQQNIIKILILFPAAGRIGSIIGAGISDYARKGEGLGKSFIEYCGKADIAAALVIYFIIFFGINSTAGLVQGLIPIVTAFLTTRHFNKKIDGATGDTLGAVCELNQVFFLAWIYILKALVILIAN